MDNLLDLRKEKVLDLKKEKDMVNVTARVVLCLDFSYSMQNLYASGFCQSVVERLLPLGLSFDDNGEVDFYLFHNSFVRIEPLTINNYKGYINRYVIGKHSMGGTLYEPVISEILKEYGGSKKNGLGGIISSFFGKKEEKTENIPTYIIYITDGDNGDKRETEAIIRKASQYPLFFQFIGIGSEKFSFLQKLDEMENRFVDNANFFSVYNLENMTDDQLYDKLMGEFPVWYQKIKQKGML